MSLSRERFRDVLSRPACTLAAELLRRVNRTEEFLRLQQQYLRS